MGTDSETYCTEIENARRGDVMKRIAFTFIVLALMTVGLTHAAPQVTEGPGISFYVTGLNDGMTFQVDVDGYFYSNGDGTYSVSCPFYMPIEFRNGKLIVWLYSGTNKLNILSVTKDGSTLKWIKRDYYFDIRYDAPAGQYDISAEGETDYQKVNAKFTLTGKKYGPRDFYVDGNGVTGKGQAKVRVLIGGVKKWERTYTWDKTGGKSIDPVIITPKPTPTPTITPRPTPTPQPTRSPGQIWAERNCWWYRA